MEVNEKIEGGDDENGNEGEWDKSRTLYQKSEKRGHTQCHRLAAAVG